MNQIESKCTIEFLRQVSMLGIERPNLEYYFDEKRKYRADFAFLRKRIIVEIEGSQHRDKAIFEKDIYKYNSAAAYGFRLLRLTPTMVLNGSSKEELRKVFKPTASYLQRCMVCLEVSDTTIHNHCYRQIFDTKEDYKIYEQTTTATAK